MHNSDSKFIPRSVTATLFPAVLPSVSHSQLSPWFTQECHHSSVPEISDPWEPHLPQAWVAACIHSWLGKEVSEDTQMDHLSSRQSSVMSKHHDLFLLIRISTCYVIHSSISDKMFCQNLNNASDL